MTAPYRDDDLLPELHSDYDSEGQHNAEESWAVTEQ